MNDIAIRTENLGKLYRIGEHRGGYNTLRETIVSTFSSLFRNQHCNPKSTIRNAQSDFIWALKDISFEVKRGEVVGIIGRNGAGKTTLLKILSRITEPTEGLVEIRGRVGSLLEVGTGFHPELTGRENIYLNGAILGMKKAEMDRKFDEIVAFAEIERFIDTPVKRYSSGMYVRLAFAVAAHLEPEILLVDEVLAVGDGAFQKKCLGKVSEVAGEGRTVLFVSHNMAAVQRLCKRAYFIEQGKIMTSGDAAPVVDAYYKLVMDRDDPVTEIRNVPEGTVRFLKWAISRSSAGNPYSCYTGEPCTISLQVVARRVVKKASFGIALWSNDGILIWAMRNLDHGGEHAFLQQGLYQIDFSVPQFPVKPGSYQIQVSVNDDFGEGALDIWYPQPKLSILPKKESGISPKWQGIVDISGKFKLSRISNHVTGVGSS